MHGSMHIFIIILTYFPHTTIKEIRLKKISQTEYTMKEIKELGKKIKSIRKKNNITLVQLSELSGISQSYLSRIENGKHDPTFSVLLQIARALQIQVGMLYEEKIQCHEHINIIRKNQRIRREQPEKDYSHFEFPTTIKNRKMRAYITEPSFTPIHVTGNDERVYFVLEGQFLLNDEVLEEGDLAYIDSNTPHSGASYGEKKARIFSVIYSYNK